MRITQEADMDWSALLGALIGAGIPAILVYVGLLGNASRRTLRRSVLRFYCSTGLTLTG